VVFNFAFDSFIPILSSRSFSGVQNMAVRTDEKFWSIARGIIRTDDFKKILEIKIPNEELSVDAFDCRVMSDTIIELINRGDDESKSAAIAGLIRIRNSSYPLRPLELRLFKEGWMVNARHSLNAQNRKKVFRSIILKLGEFLSGGLTRENLPEHGCPDNCNCPMRQNFIGDRGGTPRRVPCLLHVRRGLRRFQEHQIVMVS
jgi:hypothetical protein